RRADCADGDGHGEQGADHADRHGHPADDEPLRRVELGPGCGGRRLRLLLVEQLLRGEDRGDQLDLPGVVGGGDRVGRGLLQGVAHRVHLPTTGRYGRANAPTANATSSGWDTSTVTTAITAASPPGVVSSR